MAPVALIVDGDELFLSRLRSIARNAGYEVVGETQFEAARERLRSQHPAVVVTNMRLRAFNGIHLAYLAKMDQTRTRVIVYDVDLDRVLAREAQRAGAFFERQQRIPYSLVMYLTAQLPDRDRRDPTILDRRVEFRGGRRSTDVESLQSVLRVSVST
jgi:DNA-binding NtrC family response regulator